MEKIFLLLLIVLVGWWIGNLAAQVAYEQLFETGPSGLDMIFAIVGSSTGIYVCLYGTNAERNHYIRKHRVS